LIPAIRWLRTLSLISACPAACLSRTGTELKQSFTLQADSDSTFIFDTWWAKQQQAKDIFYASGTTVILQPPGKPWVGADPLPT
jgi:hypothetical protein